MSKQRGATIPDPICPPDKICVRLFIPNTAQWMGILNGLLLQATYLNFWDNEASYADRVAAQECWKEAFYGYLADPFCSSNAAIDLEDEMRLRISPTDPCVIQIECTPDNWEDWYNPLTCILGSGVAQPTSPTGQPGVGECQTYDAVLQGNGQWLLPVQVSSGYTIQVLGLTGAWTDGSGVWFCPDGQHYILGGCAGLQGFSGTDPLPSAYHGSLIAQIGASFYNPLTGTFTVPSGITDENMIFQFNDSDITNNGGSISFQVKVCNSTTSSASLSLDTGSNATVSTPFNTDPSKSYKVTISGRGVVGAGPTSFDAFYYDVSGTPVRATTGGSFCTFTNILEVYVDGHEFTPIPSFVSSDVYVLFLAGTGSPFAFGYCDSDYSDNHGTFTILVEQQ